ncbi:hypothetical protein DPMN_162942 [Dreissena polymorpha]|uniref:HTH psq-type domain-containing protein n=1 Tax=Dreissena polymorpha TaxID=45954 RepID=A0A9D4ER87_DREPO|nr:hypothetical protein DPMN_162942 [Dreissena polymorpha]
MNSYQMDGFDAIFIIHDAKMSKRKCFSLEDRVEVVRLLESGRFSRDRASEFGVGRTQIQNVAKRKRILWTNMNVGTQTLSVLKSVCPTVKLTTSVTDGFWTQHPDKSM